MKNPTQNILDIPTIQQEIKTKHQKFTKKYGAEIEKVFADHRFSICYMVAKLSRIAEVLREEGVIDKIVVNNTQPITEIRLWKEGMVTYLNIYTNGRTILLKGYSYSTGFGDIESSSRRYSEVDSNDFDWVKFSGELVDYIHSTLYERKEVLETKISLMLEPKKAQL